MGFSISFKKGTKNTSISHNNRELTDSQKINDWHDGQIIQTWGLELDESMLTGESRTVRHKVGEQVYSGATAEIGRASCRERV